MHGICDRLLSIELAKLETLILNANILKNRKDLTLRQLFESTMSKQRQIVVRPRNIKGYSIIYMAITV